MELLADATDMSRSFPIYFAIWYNQEDKKTMHNYLDSSEFKEASIAVLGNRFVTFIRKTTGGDKIDRTQKRSVSLAVITRCLHS